MVVKIVSGGQYGADLAGLASGRDNGIETGGWVSKGFKTIYGSNSRLKFLGVKEHSSDKYPPRTFANVKDSDGTIRFAFDFNSAGERCTFKAIEQYNKPYFDVDLNNIPVYSEVIDWIKKNNIRVLNVAGNAGRNRKESERIFSIVREYLNSVLKELRKESDV